MKTPHRVFLSSGTSLYCCCEGHALDVVEMLPEAVASAPVAPVRSGARCVHCAWCGSLVGGMPARCVWHGAGKCPWASPTEMVGVSMAVRVFVTLHRALPAWETVDGWLVMAAAGETDVPTLIAGNYDA